MRRLYIWLIIHGACPCALGQALVLSTPTQLGDGIV